MSDRVDDILDIIDVGLQQSSEPYYEPVDPTLCARCQESPPMPEGDTCARCRAFLLGDSSDDPRAPESWVRETWFRTQSNETDLPQQEWPTYDVAPHFACVRGVSLRVVWIDELSEFQSSPLYQLLYGSSRRWGRTAEAPVEWAKPIVEDALRLLPKLPPVGAERLLDAPPIDPMNPVPPVEVPA